MRYKMRNLIWLVWLLTAVFSSAAYTNNTPEFALALSGISSEISSVPAGNSLAIGSAESGGLEQACNLMYQGEFDAAGKLIRQAYKDHPAQLSPPVADQLLHIVDEYQAIDQQRQSAREAAYKEQLSEIEKLRAEADANDVNDVSDVNDLTARLSAIAKASEFADQTQREQLLSDESIKEVLQKAIDKAAEFEVEGKWLESYANCYGWLVAIDPNNEAYSDYADELWDKAGIAASLQDSPCETRKERFQGVRKDMFVRTISFLGSHYVNIIDYDKMATEAIQRCRSLADVMSTSAEFGVDSQTDGESIPDAAENDWDPKKLAAWSSTLTAMLADVESASGSSAGLTGLNRNKFLEVFEKVLKLNKATVVLPESVLIVQFVEAAMSALDPYTVIVWPRQVQDFEKMMTNEFTGIGIEISKQKGLLTVASLLPDTPAYRSGLDAGDVIQKVDGVETKDMTLMCAVHKITGPKGTKVTLTIKRAGEEKTEDITITRDRIVVPTIRGWQRTEAGKWLYMIDDQSRIGYVRITSFSAETASGLEKALLDLENKGLKGLILDLRFNTGGLLDSAVAVADKFIDDEEHWIVKRQPGFGRPPIYEPATEKGTHPNYPLVILINSSSASASEIVAGALADRKYKRAILVGARTHGKGSVQGIAGVPGGGAQLKYTMAYYHLPSGQRVESRDDMKKLGRDDWGVGPNIKVKLRSDELKKMLEVQRDNDVLVQAGHNNSNHELKKHTVEETLAADPQLAVGLLVIKSKLIQAETLAQARLN